MDKSLSDFGISDDRNKNKNKQQRENPDRVAVNCVQALLGFVYLGCALGLTITILVYPNWTSFATDKNVSVYIGITYFSVANLNRWYKYSDYADPNLYFICGNDCENFRDSNYILLGLFVTVAVILSVLKIVLLVKICLNQKRIIKWIGAFLVAAATVLVMAAILKFACDEYSVINGHSKRYSYCFYMAISLNIYVPFSVIFFNG
ncbi:hypothetical protein MHBO_000425 [Bonamia ostreae]|uniref:Uncharacterized protein n=1 Tax=Bonamia ostreae TaxID=126728 RepID=A0ABV2AG66_9EUKA